MKSFLQLAMGAYDNPQCSSVKEFESDVERFTSIKKLCSRFIDDGELKTHLLLNHVITCYNLFGQTATELIFMKVPREQWGVVSPFLMFLNQLPEYVASLGVDTSTIAHNQIVIDNLKEIDARR